MAALENVYVYPWGALCKTQMSSYLFQHLKTAITSVEMTDNRNCARHVRHLCWMLQQH